MTLTIVGCLISWQAATGYLKLTAFLDCFLCIKKKKKLIESNYKGFNLILVIKCDCIYYYYPLFFPALLQERGVPHRSLCLAGHNKLHKINGHTTNVLYLDNSKKLVFLF